MAIIWIDKNSVLTVKARTIKAGEVVPAGVIADDRLAQFERAGRIKIDNPAAPVAEPVKTRRKSAPEASSFADAEE